MNFSTRIGPAGEVWYRYEAQITCESMDLPLRPGLRLRLDTYSVLKHTPKGVWLAVGFGERRFVLRDARKRFACPTKAEALESFQARKRRQITLLRGQLWHAEQALELSTVVQ